MNYIWNVLLEARKKGVNENNISFVPAVVSSPYMEIASEDINYINIDNNSVVEVNPWFRFYDIFKEFFPSDNDEDIEVREAIFDIIMHFLGDIDLVSGVTKTYFIKQLLLKDIEDNIFGENIKENISVFDNDELDIVLEGMVNLYRCNTSLLLFNKIIKNIFKNSIVYINKCKHKNIYIYLNEEKSEKLEKKIAIIIDIFLPINFINHIYWDKHFGIIGVNETMVLNNIVMV
ncbi:hypothetical protein KQI30_11020 [Clostridium bornimense]|uniref:hypothetical protein n=1 Tax=Clostridium bornimense TaxID=1216932 RepID=UPI001C11C5D4|nr:hypothetical protein [Clostridium bornimense]MBU5316797.1 hypothetical protein [Clostridium bornimense]